MALKICRRTIVESYLEKTCWVLEGAGFEEPEPILLEVIESGARYVSDRVELHDNGSEYKRSIWMETRSIGHAEDICGIQLNLLMFCKL